jgi:uncharacterized protein
MIKHLIFLFLCLILSMDCIALDVPSLTGPVVDQARFLSEEASLAIGNGIVDLQQREGIQFQVLILNSLKDESIEGYSIRVVDEWKLGKKGDDRAALLLISVNDHKIRIEVGRGLEGSLTDFKSKKILDQMKPLLRNGDNDNAVALGLALMARTAGAEIKFNSSVVRARHARHPSSGLILFVLFLLIIFLQYIFPNTRGRGGRGGYGGFGGYGGGGYGGGGFGGGSSSGGNWSGGGGGFAGGGSSGDW